MSNAPVWGFVFYVNPPVLSPIAPGRGVVGHYIDRCITLVPETTIIPPLLKCMLVFDIVYKYRNRFQTEDVYCEREACSSTDMVSHLLLLI